ncbi:MAG: 50S ribosomal protein L15 [Candidatus Peregrinibacteria bacterium]|nr:50S ribosomal protein L15 [Candidatus Peregrinibacteria bacterium]MDZ4245413.1 50S ribosomal protein L15 [Candidatus Gracilibacteria bacterium]
MKLNERKSINPAKKKRIGRGDGSCGTYSGKGMKGQTARAGGRRRPGFEGGQTPLIRRMPKLRGFTPINKITYQVINISDLEDKFNDGDTITKEMLKKAGLIFSAKKPVKLLGNGELKKKVELTVELASVSAIDKIEKAKGTLTLTKVKKVKVEKAE